MGEEAWFAHHSCWVRVIIWKHKICVKVLVASSEGRFAAHGYSGDERWRRQGLIPSPSPEVKLRVTNSLMGVVKWIISFSSFSYFTCSREVWISLKKILLVFRHTTKSSKIEVSHWPQSQPLEMWWSHRGASYWSSFVFTLAPRPWVETCMACQLICGLVKARLGMEHGWGTWCLSAIDRGTSEADKTSRVLDIVSGVRGKVDNVEDHRDLWCHFLRARRDVGLVCLPYALGWVLWCWTWHNKAIVCGNFSSYRS